MYAGFHSPVGTGMPEDYEMIDPPMMTDYDDDLDEEVIMQKGTGELLCDSIR